MTVQSPPPPGAPPPPKKGMGPLAWIGIGCGVIILIGIIVMGAGAYLFKTKIVDPLKDNPSLVAAKLVIQASPDLELVSEDAKAQTLTIHNKKTNETITMSLDDVKNGRFKFSSEGKGAGSIDIGQQGISVKTQDEKGQVSTFVAGAGAPKDLPAWLPTYPGATVEGGFSTKSAEGSTQTFGVTTTDGVDKILAFYQDQLKNNGLTVLQPTTVAVGGQTSTGSLIADSPDKKRHVQLFVSTTGDKTKAAITYVEKP
ncbi:MAG TPA: hypothetical protein VHB47_19250 [Thermoanaerobaculia bacterium]|jgi:hypothetical protein|nr:hypothetical protein [Thermoanaerobaculia bacterium]